jgi:hypothetical protein
VLLEESTVRRMGVCEMRQRLHAIVLQKGDSEQAQYLIASMSDTINKAIEDSYSQGFEDGYNKAIEVLVAKKVEKAT